MGRGRKDLPGIVKIMYITYSTYNKYTAFIQVV